MLETRPDREAAALAAAARVGTLTPHFMTSVEAARAHYAEMRAARQKVQTYPEIDRRVTERRCSDRRAMQDVLDDRFSKNDRRLQLVPVTHSAFVPL